MERAAGRTRLTRQLNPLRELQERRAELCRLIPERALGTPGEALVFLRDRGMLTRTPDSALPSFFGACHEEPLGGQPGLRLVARD